MNDNLFTVSYDGPSLVDHQMDVKDLAPALLSIGELLEEANITLNGSRVKTAVNIKATNPGSIHIDLVLVQSIIDQAKDLFNGEGVSAIINAKTILEIIGITGGSGGVIGLILWIRNQTIKSITKIEYNKFNVELESGEVRISSKREIDLFKNIKIRQSLDTIIRKPLDREGIEKIVFNKEEDRAITKAEKEYFIAPEISEELLDEKEVEALLQIVDLTFRDGGKWKFSDGASNFFAEIKDDDFIRKISKNEIVFAKDDILKVRAKRRQCLSSGTMKTDFEILEVLEHRSAAAQLNLPFEN